MDLDNNRFLILQVWIFFTSSYVWYFERVLSLSWFIWIWSIQGEVEQISLMKPKAQGPHDEGFLEYLEDIIGTNKYVEKIEESSKQWVFISLAFFPKYNDFLVSCLQKICFGVYFFLLLCPL